MAYNNEARRPGAGTRGQNKSAGLARSTDELKRRASGRWREVVAAYGIDTPAPGRHINCPFPDHEDRHPSWRWDAAAEKWHCTCGHGDALDLVQRLEGCDFPDAVRRVAGILGISGNSDRHHATVSSSGFEPVANALPATKVTKAKRWPAARGTWDAALDLDAPAAAPARAYLEARGLKVPDPVPDALRCHTTLPYHDGGREVGRYPGLVAKVVDATGEPVGLQRIYLAPNGSGKAPVSPAKKALGSLQGGAVHLDEPREGEPLLIAEGLETALAVREATGWATWSTVSAGGMAAVVIPLGVAEVVVAADLDRSKAGQEAAHKLAARLHAEGRTVRVALPPGGPLKEEEGKSRDFLDVLTEQSAETVRRALEKAEEWSPPADDDEAIARLAAMSPLDYDRCREQEAEALGVRLGTLDRQVEAARPKPAEEATAEMGFTEVEPWPEPVAGAGLLDEITATVQRFVVCAAETARAAALWIIMTWLIDVVGVAPIAAITSPEKRCGKTVLLTLLSRLAYRPLAASNISPAALFRAVEAWTPTLLIDEADSFLKDNEDLRGVLNSGHTRSTAFVIRCDGEDLTPKRFTTWGAKALAAIGDLPGTVADRAVPLKMRRKLADENVDRLRYAEPELFDTLRAKLARWSEDHREAIRHARPELPEALHDRAQDNFEPLLAIADTAGGEWPELAREAALKLYGAEPATLSVGVELLRDIKAVFDGENHLATAVLIEHLTDDPELRWATYGRGGKPLTARQLAARLRPYGIASGTVRDGDKTAKGYKREQFAEVWKRYLPLLSPDPPVPNVTTSQRNKNNELRDFPSVTSPPLVTDRKEAKSLILKDCDVVTDRKGGVAEKKGADLIGEPTPPPPEGWDLIGDDGPPAAPEKPWRADL